MHCRRRALLRVAAVALVCLLPLLLWGTATDDSQLMTAQQQRSRNAQPLPGDEIPTAGDPAEGRRSTQDRSPKKKKAKNRKPRSPLKDYLSGKLPRGAGLQHDEPTTPASNRGSGAGGEQQCDAIGRGHRVWLRAGHVPADSSDDRGAIETLARTGANRLLAAFATNGAARDPRAPDVATAYFASVGDGDVLLTDHCGRDVPDGNNGGRIDFVFTHVDADVAGWFDQMNATFRKLHPRRRLETQRFRDNGELRYATRSLLRFARRVVRRIVFVVENAHHVERALDESTKAMAKDAGVDLIVLSHADVFPDAGVLPTFNSHAIESVLHRVPGLTPLMLYFNDDVMLGRQMSWLDLVRPMLVERKVRSRGGGSDGAQGTSSLLDVGRGLVPLAVIEGVEYTVSVMTRAAGGGPGADVWIEAEMIPYFEFEYGNPREYGANVSASWEVDPSNMSPDVNAACGPREYIESAREAHDAAHGARLYDIAATRRRNRALAWNYLGVHAVHHEAHKAHFIDRAHMEQMMEGDAWTGAGPWLPPHLTRFTRESQFRRVEDVKTIYLGQLSIVADNWRRRKQLQVRFGGDVEAKREMLQCTTCPASNWKIVAECYHRPSEIASAIGVALMPNASSAGELGEIAAMKLLSPVVQMRIQWSGFAHPDYFYYGARSLHDLQTYTRELQERPRLWVAINDIFDTDDQSLSPKVLAAFDHLLQVATGETASSTASTNDRTDHPEDLATRQ